MVLEEWDFVEDRDLQNWKGGVVCMTCQHFIFGVDQKPHGGGLQPQATPAGARRPSQEEMQALGPHLAEGDGMGCPMTFALFIFLLHLTDWLAYAAKTKIEMLLVKCRRLAT